MRNRIYFFAIGALSLFFSGCSVFHVRDTFKVAEDNSEAIKYTADPLKIRVQIEPDTRFYSVGLLGLPIIPLHFKISDATELALTFELSLSKDSDFSFLFNSCLIIDNSKPICPKKLDLYVFANFLEDGFYVVGGRRQFYRNPVFHKSNLIITPQTVLKNSLITREHIYRHYGYTGKEKWDYLRVNLTYLYQCETTCPEKVSFRLKDFVVVENILISDHRYTFERKRENDYQFRVLIQ